MKPTVTPLRYPGGKTWLFEYVKEFLHFHELESKIVVEPYAGSASISVGLLRGNLMKEAYIGEKDPIIVSFWNAVLTRNDELVEYISTLEVTMETWFALKKYLSPTSTTNYDIVEVAGAFLFYNRTNYSGIIKGGPLGGKKQLSPYKLDCRFNKERIIERIRGLKGLYGRLHIVESDGLVFMQEMSSKFPEDSFFYVDPPYYGAGKDLYRFYFTDMEHESLSDFLTNLDPPWLLSYDNAEFIRNLYQMRTKFPVYTDYQSGHLKREVKELLISNRIIPPIAPKISHDTQACSAKKETIQDVI